MISFLKEKVANYTQLTLRCVYCHDDLNEQGWTCPRCSCKTHSQCAAELTECPTLGCREPLDAFASRDLQITVRNSQQEAAMTLCRSLRGEQESLKGKVSFHQLVFILWVIFTSIPTYRALKTFLKTIVDFYSMFMLRGEYSVDYVNWYIENFLHISLFDFCFSASFLLVSLIVNLILLKRISRNKTLLTDTERKLKEARDQLRLI